jgi:tRNA (guanine6-N2)-methyltransferase
MPSTQQDHMTSKIFEAEIAPGLETVVQDELRQKFPHITNIQRGRGVLRFEFQSGFMPLLQLRTVNALYQHLSFDVPRPKALLGHQHFQRLARALVDILQAYPQKTFQSLSIDAAGSESSVMQRLRDELANVVQLTPSSDRGDLVVKIRPTPDRTGWEVLLRISPRPLATREWRIANFEGALNAAVAHAMIRLTNPSPDDQFLNLCSGSGTLMIERVLAGETALICGCDISAEILALSQQNMAAAGIKAELLQADVTKIPFLSRTFDKIVVDLPFGQLVGSHQQNRQLYPRMLEEMSRVLQPNGAAVVITHEIRLFESLLDANAGKHTHDLKLENVYKITLNGLHPRIYVLRKSKS